MKLRKLHLYHRFVSVTWAWIRFASAPFIPRDGALSRSSLTMAFRRCFLLILFSYILSAPCHSFEGVGECSKILTDYAYLLKKSVYIPQALTGNCVVRNEKDLPLIFKSAGFNYSARGSVISLSEIREKTKSDFKPKKKNYVVNFAFLNKSSVIDCGLKMNDIIATFDNLKFSFSLSAVLGCPALDYDGSFGFSVNASLIDAWQYTHGVEEKRADSEITSAAGAVTTSYRYITTGLDIQLYQTDLGVFYLLRYTSKNGSITTSKGAVTQFVESDVTESFKSRRKLWFIPIGWEISESSYKMILQIKELQ